jgi:ABC-type dipeptide/oligopeptide/nickel transport system permease component
MLWINLGLVSLNLVLVIGLASILRPRWWPIGRIFMALGLQVSGILVVTWFLVERGQAVGSALPPPPGQTSAILAAITAPTLASLELILVAAVLGTCVGTAAAAAVTWSRRSWLNLVLAIGSLVWIVPTFVIAILLQDLQSAFYGLSGVNIAGAYGRVTPELLFWSAAVLAIRPAAYAYRQGHALIAEESHADFVRTAFAKGLDWHHVVLRHIIRPVGSGLITSAASSIRLMLGSLPLVEFFFAYPGLGKLLLLSLGVAYGDQRPQANPPLAIASAVILASMLAVFEAVFSLLRQRLDPRLAEEAA